MKKTILSVSLFFASQCLHADPTQSLDLLKTKIETQVLSELATQADDKVQLTTGKLDARLNLRPCAEDQLTVFNPYQTPILNTSTMGIKCMEGNNHWTLYVPIKIKLLKSVFVAKKALVKGARIHSSDVYQLEMDVQRLKQGYFTDSHELLGQVCKQNIPANNPLNPYNIELAKLVHKGETVSILASNDNIVISMDGIALENGALGEPIKVKNLSSKRVVEVLVSGKKKVKVIL